MSEPQRRSSPPHYDRQQRVYLYAEIAFFVACGVGTILLISRLSSVLWPLFVAAAIAYLLDPAADRLEARGLSRERAILALVVLALAVLTGIALLLVPIVAHEIALFSRKLPQYLEVARPYVERFSTDIFAGIDGFKDAFSDSSSEMYGKAWSWGREILGGAARGVSGALGMLVGIALVPFFSYYCLRDFDRFVERLPNLIPVARRDSVVDAFREIDATLASWVRGQLLVMAIQGTLYSIGLVALGVPLGVVIGIFSGAMCFIPYIGMALGLCLAILQCLLEYQGAWQLGAVLALYAGVQVLDGLAISPRILGGRLGLSPLAVITAVMVGGNVAGFVGVLLAVPAAACIMVVFRRGLYAYRHSDFYGDTGEQPRA